MREEPPDRDADSLKQLANPRWLFASLAKGLKPGYHPKCLYIGALRVRLGTIGMASVTFSGS